MQAMWNLCGLLHKEAQRSTKKHKEAQSIANNQKPSST